MTAALLGEGGKQQPSVRAAHYTRLNTDRFVETEHAVSAAIWQPLRAPANKDELYLFIFQETHHYGYFYPKWGFGIQFGNYYRVLYKCWDSLWKATSQQNWEPTTPLLPQLLKLHHASCFL